MTLRRSQPLLFTPRSLTDAADATPLAPGAMAAAANLIPDPAMDGGYVARPAAVNETVFAGFVPEAPGVLHEITALVVVGDIAYGMIANDGTGKDNPFAYNIDTGVFLLIQYGASPDLPDTLPATGDWTPPIMTQVGSRIILCHRGFPGGPIRFGWLDVSGAELFIVGNIESGSLVITGNPATIGLQPGLLLSAAGIEAGTTVKGTADFQLITTGDTHTSTTLDNIDTVVGVAVGQIVSGLNILPGTTVAAIVATTVTLSQAATGSTTGQLVTFDGATITMSQDATASTDNLTITAEGGTNDSPLWGAGDTDRNPLPRLPVHVDSFNGRAYFAVGPDGVVWSDAGFPCRVSNTTGVQAWLSGDGLAITALGQLGVSVLTGGIVQGLIAWAGVSRMYQFLGDQALGNLTVNALQAAAGSGTEAPLSITPTEAGLAYISPQGLRFIDFQGRVSPPIGRNGSGVVLPFVRARYPSRINGTANAGVLRFSVERGDMEGPAQEFWYDQYRDIWTGPHSFPSSHIEPWRATFILVADGVDRSLWSSAPYQSNESVYIERGEQMRWRYRPARLPDNRLMAMNSLVEMTVALSGIVPIELTARDINGVLLDETIIANGGIFNVSLWDEAAFAANVDIYQQVPVFWHAPLVFKQLDLLIEGDSDALVRIGNLYMRYQVLGYQVQLQAIPT